MNLKPKLEESFTQAVRSSGCMVLIRGPSVKRSCYNTPMADNLSQMLHRLANELRKATRILCLTGAGVSAESGVPTFRDARGLWEGARAEDLATREAFQRDPDLVWRFYRSRRLKLLSVYPNPAHEIAPHTLEAVIEFEEQDLHSQAPTRPGAEAGSGTVTCCRESQLHRNRR